MKPQRYTLLHFEIRFGPKGKTDTEWAVWPGTFTSSETAERAARQLEQMNPQNRYWVEPKTEPSTR